MSIKNKILSIVIFLFPVICLCQCDESIEISASLSGGQSEEIFVELNQNITNITFNLNDYHSDGSWMIPRDLIVEILAPNGNCISGEGFNIPPLENCITIDWPSSWGEGNGPQNLDGNHSHSIAIPDNHLYGDGIWHFLIKNGRENGNNNEAHYNLEIILENTEGCTNELAENYNEFAICDDGNCLTASSNICEAEVNFTWVLDNDWCESWCKIFDNDGNIVAGYFSACQNQGCAACDMDDLYTWYGEDVAASFNNETYIISQNYIFPEGEYFIEMFDGYGDGWSDNPTGGIDAFVISGNIDYSIDFTNGYLTNGFFTLSCEPGEGCTDEIACNYDSNAIVDDDSCLYYDECGICDGDGIPNGECDCFGNTLDAIGVCGGNCNEDNNGDGICDDCIGDIDECGICNGPGAIYGCGCNEIPEGDCDCEGNILDAIGECGGDCDFDQNGNGICDDEEVLGCVDPTACNFNSEATSDDGSCDFCSCISDEDYTLTIESSVPTVAAGTTYRFYINMVNPTDHMSAVVGNNDLPLLISTPEGAFNTPINSSWNAEGINPNFIPFFPELVDDSYATIGLDVSTSMAGILGADAPGLVEDTSQPITTYFMEPYTTEINVTSIIGASYYVTNGAVNGLPDENNRVLIMQITTTGSLSGLINYQIFPEGIGANALIKSVEFSGVGTFGEEVGGEDLCGCNDTTACNYNQNVVYNDGSCLYNDVCGICDGPGAIYECGCADIPDGDCDCNGNQLDALGECGGDCLEDLDEDGVCDDVDECVGEYDECGVCNGPGAIYECGCADIPDGDCDCEGNVLDIIGECGGDCTEDLDEDGVCDDEEIYGCTDVLACNYDPNATEENGLCSYDCYGCVDPMACNFNEEATIDDGGCIMPGDPCDDDLAYTEDDFLQSDCSCNGYGCTDSDACNFVEGALTDNSMCNYVGTFSITGALSSNTDMIVEYSYPNTSGSIYEWTIIGGDIIDGEGTSTVEVVWWGDFEGQLCVVETNEEGCSGDPACIDVTIINSIVEIGSAMMNIYPNPAKDILNIELNGPNYIQMFDLLSREVWAGIITDVGQIDLRLLERGVYLIRANIDGVYAIERVVVH